MGGKQLVVYSFQRFSFVTIFNLLGARLDKRFDDQNARFCMKMLKVKLWHCVCSEIMFSKCQKLTFSEHELKLFQKHRWKANISLLSIFFFKCEVLKISSQNCIMTKILKKNLLAWHRRSPLCFCLVASVYLLFASNCSLFVPLSLLACCFIAIARISCPHCFAWLESYGHGWKLELKKISGWRCRDEKRKTSK